MLKRYLLSSVARSPETESGAPTPPPDESEPLGEEGMRETLAFDAMKFLTPPAKEGEGGGEAGEPSEGGDKDPAASAASSAQAGSAPAADQSGDGKKEGEGDDPMAALREAVKGFLDKKPATEQAAKPAPAQEEQKPKQPAEGEFKGYDFSLPEEIVEALGSDEPAIRRKAVNGIVNGLANKLAKDFGTAMAEMAKQIRAEAVQAALGHIDSRTNEQKVRDDFYTAYPDLKELVDNLPALDGVIWSTAHQLSQATGQKNWTPQLRDQVGAAMRLQLKLPAPAGVTAQPQGNGQRPPRKGTFSAGGGPSPGARPNGQASPQDDMLAVVNANG